MTALTNRAVARVVSAHARDQADELVLLDMLGLIDPATGQLVGAPATPSASSHDRVGHDEVQHARPPRPATTPPGLTAATSQPTAAPVPVPPSPTRSTPRKKVTVPIPAPAEEPPTTTSTCCERPTAVPDPPHPDEITLPANAVGSPTWLLAAVREHDDQAVRRAAGHALISWVQLRLAHEDLIDVAVGGAA